MKLQHPASFDIAELSKIIDVQTLSEFIKNVVKYGKAQDPDIYEPLKYTGDCWEVFAEFFFKFHNGDHTLTYTANYEPNVDYDRGIDGSGISTLDGKLCVHQHKFKANPTAYLTNDDNISCISEKQISRRVDKNVVFWNDFREVIKNQSYDKE